METCLKNSDNSVIYEFNKVNPVKNRLRSLIAINKVEIVIEDLLDLITRYTSQSATTDIEIETRFDQVIILSSNFQSLQSKMYNGVIEHDVSIVAVNKIKHSVLFIINELPERFYEFFEAEKEKQRIEALAIELHKQAENELLREMVTVEGGMFEFVKTIKNKEMHLKLQVDSFLMDKYPVTYKQYKDFCLNTGRKIPDVPDN